MGKNILFCVTVTTLKLPQTNSTIMKVVLVLLLAAVASSVPAGYFYSSPYLAGYPAYYGYNHYGYAARPVVKYVQPVVKTVAVAAPAPGYVAETPGSLHTAPLPVGPSGDGFYASHHINNAAAPGTK